MDFSAALNVEGNAEFDPAEQRRSPRYTSLIRAAKLVSGQGEFICVVRDVSATGISLRTFHGLPEAGQIALELQNGESYEISVASVQINERRVEEAQLRAELGLGDIQDTVDSQNDLTAAQTELVSSIVDHNIAKLEFWRDVGLLYVDDSGQWEEGVDEPR